MPKLSVFNSVSLDGYFTDKNSDMSWAHKNDPEFNEFIADNAKGGSGPLLFGRVTYEMMASFWPTKEAIEMFPDVAMAMNNLPKVVFSRTLEKADWNNTRVIKDNLVDEVRKMKDEDGDDMIIMGSGTIVSQLTQAGLIDEYQVVVNPIVLGSGRTMFEGVDEKFELQRTHLRSFGNGNIFILYERA